MCWQGAVLSSKTGYVHWIELNQLSPPVSRRSAEVIHSGILSVQDLMLILNPWGFDVSDLSLDTRASVHLSAFPNDCARGPLACYAPLGSEAIISVPPACTAAQTPICS